MKTEIIQYKRDRKNNPIGVVVAVKNGDLFDIGWSKVAEGDSFNKRMGLQIARGRAVKGTRATLPRDMQETFETVNERAGKEFKISI